MFIVILKNGFLIVYFLVNLDVSVEKTKTKLYSIKCLHNADCVLNRIEGVQ